MSGRRPLINMFFVSPCGFCNAADRLKMSETYFSTGSSGPCVRAKISDSREKAKAGWSINFAVNALRRRPQLPFTTLSRALNHVSALLVRSNLNVANRSSSAWPCSSEYFWNRSNQDSPFCLDDPV